MDFLSNKKLNESLSCQISCSKSDFFKINIDHIERFVFL